MTKRIIVHPTHNGEESSKADSPLIMYQNIEKFAGSLNHFGKPEEGSLRKSAALGDRDAVKQLKAKQEKMEEVLAANNRIMDSSPKSTKHFGHAYVNTFARYNDPEMRVSTDPMTGRMTFEQYTPESMVEATKNFAAKYKDGTLFELVEKEHVDTILKSKGINPAIFSDNSGKLESFADSAIDGYAGGDYTQLWGKYKENFVFDDPNLLVADQAPTVYSKLVSIFGKTLSPLTSVYTWGTKTFSVPTAGKVDHLRGAQETINRTAQTMHYRDVAQTTMVGFRRVQPSYMETFRTGTTYVSPFEHLSYESLVLETALDNILLQGNSDANIVGLNDPAFFDADYDIDLTTFDTGQVYDPVYIKNNLYGFKGASHIQLAKKLYEQINSKDNYGIGGKLEYIFFPAQYETFFGSNSFRPYWSVTPSASFDGSANQVGLDQGDILSIWANECKIPRENIIFLPKITTPFIACRPPYFSSYSVRDLVHLISTGTMEVSALRAFSDYGSPLATDTLTGSGGLIQKVDGVLRRLKLPEVAFNFVGAHGSLWYDTVISGN